MKTFVIFAMMLFFVGCGAMEYNLLESGAYSKHTKKDTLIITNSDELKALYLSHKVGVILPNSDNLDIKVPSVDFDTQRVVAFFVGQKSTGGYGIEINEIKDSDTCDVYYSYTVPNPNSSVVDSLTSAYKIIVINTTKKINLIKQ